jgi:streptogramin lyase
MVTTMAGSGALLPSGLAVQGGYADGDAHAARFNHPSGVAVGSDGSVYVADALNHCIRRISGGVVSTFAGSPQRAQAHDGPLAQAAFHEPRGLAFAPSGALYVADNGVGIRIIRAGVVSTLAVPEGYQDYVKTAVSVASASHRLFVTSRVGMVRLSMDDPNDPPLTGLEGFSPYGVAPFNDIEFVVSSLTANTLTFSTLGFWRIVSGERGADVSAAGGFVDGLPEAARFNAPMGLVLDGQRNIMVADAGNRRIRLIPAVNERWESYSPSGADPNVYHVVFISNSFAYYNSMWDDSIAGIIEQRLNADRAVIGLSKRVEVLPMSKGNSLSGHGQYISSVLAQGGVDLVIWSLNTNMFMQHFDVWPFIESDFSKKNNGAWRKIIRDTAASLHEAGVRLLLTDSPIGHQTSLAEVTRWRDFPRGDVPLDPHPEWRFMERRPDAEYGVTMNMERFLVSLGVDDYMPTYERFLEYERGPHLPLCSSDNAHFNPVGNALYARMIVDHLESVRPWMHH